MDNVTFTTIVNFTVGRQSLESLVKGNPVAVQQNNVTVRLELDDAMLKLLTPLFPERGKDAPKSGH